MECDGKQTGCWAHLEWHCRHAGIARVFSEEQQMGDSYCYDLQFVVRKRYWFPRLKAWWTKHPVKWGLIEYIGVLIAPTRCQYKALRKAMRDSGWGILSTRVKDGKFRTIEICRRGKTDHQSNH